MNSTHRGIILLMKSAATGQRGILPDDFSLQEAMPVITAHQIAPLAYTGAVNCGENPQNPAMVALLQTYCSHMLQSELQMRQISRIFRCFRDNGVDFLPLKGCVMKTRYPRPDLRSMGDADILVRMTQYERIVPLMESLGFSRVKETDHEMVWRSKGLCVELHRWLIPSYNKDFYAYFRDGWHLARPVNGTQYEMAPEDEFIFLLTHFAKHYRDGGVGCRHVLDLYVFLRTFPHLDEGYMQRELDKLMLLSFYQNIRRLLGYWFGDEPADPVTAHMTDYIFDGGYWGQKLNHIISNKAKQGRTGLITRTVRLRSWLGALFPEPQDLATLYPIVGRRVWLTPVFWVWRWFDVLLHRRRNLKNRARTLRQVSYRNVTGFRQAMEYVGLALADDAPL